MQRNEEGVSPVIATILMVAITVVLAATLYVMVSGNMLGTPYTSNKLVASLKEDFDKSSSKSVVFDVIMTIPNKVPMSDIEITIINNGSTTKLTHKSGLTWSNATAGGKWHYEAMLSDLDGNGKFSDGDELTVIVVDDNPSDSVTPPQFHSGEKVVFSITGYHGVSSNGKIL